MSHYVIEPADDEHNVKTIAAVKPASWVNPKPKPEYRMLVVGAGSAGLTCASGSAGLGASVALVEINYMGGDCLNVGCVPSKALIRSGKAAHAVAQAAGYGAAAGSRRSSSSSASWKDVIARVRSVRAQIAPHDGAERFKGLGVDVFLAGGCRFTSKNTLVLEDGTELKFRKCCIATGGHPFVPPIPGLADAGYVTNESVFNMQEQPRSLAVIGAGPIGAEMAQAFARLGTRVTLLDQAEHILPREDPDAAALVQSAMVAEGVQLELGVSVKSVAPASGGKRRITYEVAGASKTAEFDQILVSVGRRPNLDGLDLEAAGVKASPRGIHVDDYLRTANKNIFAAGDCTDRGFQFTHVAGHAAGIVIRNALFPGRGRRFSSLVIPWCTYTQPEIAHVGAYASDLTRQGVAFTTVQVDLDDVDRAIADGATQGFVRMHVAKGKDTILGCTIVGKEAGTMISEVTLAMTNKLGLAKFSYVIHPYPTISEAVYACAMKWRKTKLTPTAAKVLGTYFKWT